MSQISSKKILAIHGVNTDGQGIAAAAENLQPLFDVVRVEYPDFNHWLKLPGVVLNRWMLALAIGVAGATVFGGVPWWGWLIVAGLLLGGFVAARRNRRRLLDRLKVQLDKGNDIGRPPDVIAHSYGTYLIGSALNLFRDLRADHIVLVGSVLPSGFGWKKLTTARGGEHAFWRVWNEVGGNDGVVLAASLVGRYLKPPMGRAGRVGFSGEPSLIHKLEDPNGTCPTCAGAPPVGPLVHNVEYLEYEHSTAFISPKHAKLIWLPILWDLIPAELDDFAKKCTWAAAAERDGNRPKLGVMEDALRTRPYQFLDRAGQTTLADYVVRELARKFPTRSTDPQWLADESNAVIHSTWNTIDKALNEFNKPPAERNFSVAACLNPTTAISKALLQVK